MAAFRNPNFHNANRAGDEVKSSRHMSQGDESMAVPNVPDRAEALEAADHGHLQELAMWNAIVGFAATPEPLPLDPELARLVSSDLAISRERLIEAMKLLDANRDQEGASEMHLRAGTAVNEIDEAAAKLAEGLVS